MDSCLQHLKVKLQERDWLDEGKNIKVSQSEAEKGGSIHLPTWDAAGDSQIQQQSFLYFLQIYTIHMNNLFQGENGKFGRKVTSLHP